MFGDRLILHSLVNYQFSANHLLEHLLRQLKRLCADNDLLQLLAVLFEKLLLHLRGRLGPFQHHGDDVTAAALNQLVNGEFDFLGFDRLAGRLAGGKLVDGTPDAHWELGCVTLQLLLRRLDSSGVIFFKPFARGAAWSHSERCRLYLNLGVKLASALLGLGQQLRQLPISGVLVIEFLHKTLALARQVDVPADEAVVICTAQGESLQFTVQVLDLFGLAFD